MTRRTVLLSIALVFPSVAALGPRSLHADEKPKVASVTPDLSGHWVYNRELSDDAREKMREGMAKGGGGMGGSGGGGRGGPPPGGMGGDDDPRQAMRAILEPAEELTIARTATEIALEEKFGETRHLHPDGKKYKTDNGGSDVKASWKEGKLVVETKRARGGSVVETWELVPDGSRILVNVKMEGGFGPGVTLKRIYDRAEGAAAR
jgi:hypothetical protein